MDALNHGPVFSRLMPGHQPHLAGVGLVQRRIVDHQHAPGWVHMRRDLLPQRVRVWLQPVQQPAKGVMRRRGLKLQRHSGRLRTAVSPRRGNQKLDVIGFGAFGGIHPLTLTKASTNCVTLKWLMSVSIRCAPTPTFLAKACSLLDRTATSYPNATLS